MTFHLANYAANKGDGFRYLQQTPSLCIRWDYNDLLMLNVQNDDSS